MVFPLRLLIFLLLFTLFLSSSIAFAQSGGSQDEATRGPFQTVSGKHIEIVTDLPLSDEIRDLPAAFDAAMPQWCELFGMELSSVADWKTTAYIMLDRSRFQRAGMIPDSIPEFPYGFQYGNQLWVVEQPSDYYRRHLLLHEGTHWFMNRKYGRSGPPWIMEGMAELLGTHRWEDGELQLGIIPQTKTDVPYWGRISLIQDQLTEGIAPSLESILRYGPTAHRQVEAYAWSWAAVVFLKNHPHTSKAFEALLARPMRGDSEMNRWLFGTLKTRWPKLRQDWSAFLSDLEYGYDPSRGIFQMSDESAWLKPGESSLTVQADRTWQGTGWVVKEGQRIKVNASGMYSVGDYPAPWETTAAGVTLEYYRSQPLGKLLVALGAPEAKELSFTPPLEVIAVGNGLEFDASRTGELFFRINESNGGLHDNSGTVEVTIKP